MRQIKVVNHSAFPGFVNEVGYTQLRVGLKTHVFCVITVRVHARKLKKCLGPHLNKSIEYVLRNEVGCDLSPFIDIQLMI